MATKKKSEAPTRASTDAPPPVQEPQDAPPPAEPEVATTTVPTGPKETMGEKLAREHNERQARKAEKQKVYESEQYQHVLLCRICERPGIYFTKNPVGLEIRDHEWFSSYKEKDDEWHESQIPCQFCLAEGRPTVLIIVRPDMKGWDRERARGHPFTVRHKNADHTLKKIPRDPDRADREGYTPSVDKAVPETTAEVSA